MDLSCMLLLLVPYYKLKSSSHPRLGDEYKHLLFHYSLTYPSLDSRECNQIKIMDFVVAAIGQNLYLDYWQEVMHLSLFYETEDYMPLPLYLSHLTLRLLAAIRRDENSPMPYLRPDAKAQFTVEYDAETNRPLRVHTIVLSTQHDEFDTDEAMHSRIEADVRNILLPKVRALLPPETAVLLGDDVILHVNPTGKFVIGGPGLTGRKVIVDTYGGKGAHGGGAFSGKDPSKVDRSAAYAARWVAKNMVAAGVADEMLVQISYAIGISRPVSIYVNSYGTARPGISDSEMAEKIGELFDLRPAAIIRKFGLKNPIYEPTAAYGHVGRKPYTAPVEVERNGKKETVPVRFFAWEDLDAVETIRTAFKL